MRSMIVGLLLVAMILLPGIALAQEAEPAPVVVAPTWTITTARSIIWIGEPLIAVINGTGNTTVLLELRTYNVTANTMGNATYSEIIMIDWTGLTAREVPASATENPGEYQFVLMTNNTAVAYWRVTINYDPQRYDEIQRQKIWDYLHGYVQDWINSSIAYDAAHEYRLDKNDDQDYAQWAVLIAIILIQTPVWINRYAAYKRRTGKGSLGLRIINRLDDRTLTYGGSVIGQNDPALPQKHHDTMFTTWDLDGMNTDSILDKIQKNTRDIGAPLPPKAVSDLPPEPGFFAKRKAAKAAKTAAKAAAVKPKKVK